MPASIMPVLHQENIIKPYSVHTLQTELHGQEDFHQMLHLQLQERTSCLIILHQDIGQLQNHVGVEFLTKIIHIG